MKTKVAEILSLMTQNLPEMAFLFFSIRLTILGASIGDALALISVVAYIGYKHFINEKKLNHTDEVKTKLEELEKTMAALKVDKVLQRGQPGEQKTQQIRRF
jgi:hypothetical protein